MKVENSDIRVRSLYSEHFLIQGQRGTFHVGNLHGHGIGKKQRRLSPKFVSIISRFLLFSGLEYRLDQNRFVAPLFVESRSVIRVFFRYTIGAIDGDVSLQCEKGDVDVFFSSTEASTIRAQTGTVTLTFLIPYTRGTIIKLI